MVNLKRILAGVCILTVLVGTTACSNESSSKASNGEKIDVVLWNTNGDRAPAATGVYLMEYAAEMFEDKTGVEVNLISIEANTQEDYFKKRVEILLSEDQPEMILFNTRYPDELQVIESMQDELLPVEGNVDNIDDVFEGMKGETYSAIAILSYGNMMNRDLATQLGQDSSVAFMTTEAVEDLYMKWTQTSEAKLNVFDYSLFSELGLTNMIRIEADKAHLETSEIVKKIKRNAAFIAALPSRQLEKKDILEFNTNKNSELYTQERDEFMANGYLRPVNYLTKVSFNTFDILDFSSQVSEYESGFAMADYSMTTAIGFGILDNQSKEQSGAVAFANYLLSPEFQLSLGDYSKESPKISGSVLMSIQADQMLNGKPVSPAIIEAHEKLREQFNQPGAIQHAAISSASIFAIEEILKLSTEYIWGETMTDEALEEALVKLEAQLNLMVKE